MNTIKSKQRVADHGEVFTPAWMVEAMLDLMKEETERIDARFLEPACGSGNFLVQILRRKLAAVERKYGRSDFERRCYALQDFHLLVQLRVFNTEQMNQAVFAFRRYEDASLRYAGIDSHEELTHYGLYDTVVARE